MYPTVTDGDGNASLDGDHQAEIGAVTAQAARYSAVCDVHAPLYRQVTLPERGLRTDDPELVEIAYGDVLDAWKHYINNADADRGVILIGHSHGSGHLLRLLAEEIDPRQDLRSRLVAAHVIGLTVAVAEGADRGDGTLGDLENIAVCGSADDVGCVLSNSSFLNTEPPGPLAFYGTAGDGEQVVCVHPGAPEGGPALLDTVFDARQPAFSDDHLASGDAPEIETTWISLPGLITGECVTDGDHTWFEITVNADTDDPRVDDIAGAALPEFLGLHIVDMSLGLGDLTRLAGTQAESWSAREG